FLSEESSKKEVVDLKVVIKSVGKIFPHTLEELRSKNRNKDLVFVRQIVMYVMKKVTDKSLRDIGSYLGGRNHATVKHSLSKIEHMIATNTKMQQQINSIIQECG